MLLIVRHQKLFHKLKHPWDQRSRSSLQEILVFNLSRINPQPKVRSQVSFRPSQSHNKTAHAKPFLFTRDFHSSLCGRMKRLFEYMNTYSDVPLLMRDWNVSRWSTQHGLFAWSRNEGFLVLASLSLDQARKEDCITNMGGEREREGYTSNTLVHKRRRKFDFRALSLFSLGKKLRLKEKKCGCALRRRPHTFLVPSSTE